MSVDVVSFALLILWIFQKNQVMGGPLCSEADMFQKDMGLRLCSMGDSTERRYQKTTMFAPPLIVLLFVYAVLHK